MARLLQVCTESSSCPARVSSFCFLEGASALKKILQLSKTPHYSTIRQLKRWVHSRLLERSKNELQRISPLNWVVSCIAAARGYIAGSVQPIYCNARARAVLLRDGGRFRGSTSASWRRCALADQLSFTRQGFGACPKIVVSDGFRVASAGQRPKPKAFSSTLKMVAGHLLPFVRCCQAGRIPPDWEEPYEVFRLGVNC